MTFPAATRLLSARYDRAAVLGPDSLLRRDAKAVCLTLRIDKRDEDTVVPGVPGETYLHELGHFLALKDTPEESVAFLNERTEVPGGVTPFFGVIWPNERTPAARRLSLNEAYAGAFTLAIMANSPVFNAIHQAMVVNSTYDNSYAESNLNDSPARWGRRVHTFARCRKMQRMVVWYTKNLPA